MLSQPTKTFIWALSLANLAHSLPGRQALTARQCSNSAGDLYGSPCSDDASSITAAPVPRPAFHPKNKVISVTCDSIGICSAFDVSSSLVTVFNGSDITRTDWPSPSAPSFVPIVTTGSAEVSEPSSVSRGPFANSTYGSLTAGPTGTGTGRVSSTGLSPSEANSTTVILSTITLSVTTFTESSHWSAWTNWPGATGTGGSSKFSTPTATGPFSNTTSPTPSYVNSTFVSAGQNLTSQVPVTTQSYVSTATYIFSGTTIEIPIPDSYSNGLPTVISAQTTTSEEKASRTTETTYSTCRTTTEYASTGTGVTTATAHSTLICWGIACVDHVCYDFSDRYPLTADSTSGPFTNETTLPTASGPGAIYSTDDAFPTDSPSSVWPSSNATRNPDAYTNTDTYTATPATASSPSTEILPVGSKTYYSTDSAGNVFTSINVETFLPTPAITQTDSIMSSTLQPGLAVSTASTKTLPLGGPVLTTIELSAAEAIAAYTFTATDSSGNAFTTTYTGELPESWIDAPSDSSAFISQLSEATAPVATDPEAKPTSSPSTFAWADWPSTLSTSTTSTSDVLADTAMLRTAQPLPGSAGETGPASATTSVSIYGGESRSQKKRAEVKQMREEKRSTKEVKNFGLWRKAAEMEKMGLVVEDDGDSKCRGLVCWL